MWIYSLLILDNPQMEFIQLTQFTLNEKFWNAPCNNTVLIKQGVAFSSQFFTARTPALENGDSLKRSLRSFGHLTGRALAGKDKTQAKWAETKTKLQKTRTRGQDRPDQMKHCREQKAAGREEETALFIALLENGGDRRMGSPQENGWAAGPGGHRHHLGQRSGLAGYGAQASGLLITLVWQREMCTWQLLRHDGFVCRLFLRHTVFS